ncbi:MAG: hypothetical protein QXS06_03615 [Desulfurococcaceae archaeon]
MHSRNLAIALVSRDGDIVEFIPLGRTEGRDLDKVIRVSFDVYRVVNHILRNLNMNPPRNISMKYEDLEVIIIPRGDKLVMTMVEEFVSSISKDVAEAPA